MSVSVTCSQCGVTHKVKDAARGRKVRCPTDGCGQVLKVPGQAQPQPLAATQSPSQGLTPVQEGDTVETFRLSIPQEDTAPAGSHRSPQDEDVERPVSQPRGAYFEVLHPDGTIVPMDRKAIRLALRKGTLTRFSLMRRVEDNDIQFSEHGFVKQRPPREHPWQAVGKELDLDHDEPGHVSRAARGAMMQRDSVFAYSAGIAMAILAVYLGVALYAAEWDVKQWSEEASEAIASSSVTSQNRDWRFQAIVLFANTFPDAGALMGKSLLFLLGLLPASVLALVIGLVCAVVFDVGYRIVHYDSKDKPQGKTQPWPSDGYPWKFWKAWEQKRLLRHALLQRAQASGDRKAGSGKRSASARSQS